MYLRVAGLLYSYKYFFLFIVGDYLKKDPYTATVLICLRIADLLCCYKYKYRK